jgi:hypothetical protein
MSLWLFLGRFKVYELLERFQGLWFRAKGLGLRV